MKISKKVSIILIGVQCVFTGLSIGLANFSFTDYVDVIEAANAKKVEDRFIATLNMQRNSIANRANDWANWDDAYKFIQGLQPDFVEKNINDAYLKIAKINHILFFDLKGKLVHGSSTFSPFEKWESTNQELTQTLSQFTNLHPNQNISDILKYKERLILWSMTPVRESEGKLPASGYLVMARELDSINSPDFEDYFGHSYSIETNAKAGAVNIELNNFSQDELDIHFAIKDSHHQLLATALVKIARSENIVAARTKQISLVILLSLVFVSVFVTYFLIHFLIIRRLTKVTKDIPQILSGHSSMLIVESTQDEIGDFTRFFNTSIRLFREQTEKTNEAQLSLSHSAQLSAVGEIAGSIVHEIKNPLTIFAVSISYLKKMLAKRTIDYEKFDERLIQLEMTSKKINSIVNTVSRFSRKNSKDFNQSILLKNIFEDALFLMTEKIRKQNTTIKNTTDENIEICCNPVLLSLVLSNLLSNSLDAIAQIENPWISLDFNLTETDYEISVTDCGPGLSAEFVAQMNQAYFTTKPPGKGTGLGLSFSRKVMTDMKGTISYDKTCPNTRFILRFPKPILETKNEPHIAA